MYKTRQVKRNKRRKLNRRTEKDLLKYIKNLENNKQTNSLHYKHAVSALRENFRRVN